MLISDHPRFLFVHIPKTAGKSIARALDRPKHPLCSRDTKHESVQSFVDRVGEEVFRSYFSFAVVRHPLDRFLSHFSYLKTNQHKFPEISVVPTVEAYIAAIEAGNMTVIRRPERVLPQNHYVRLGSTPIAVDAVLRFEHLQDELHRLCLRLDLPPPVLGQFNKSERQRITDPPRVTRFVENYYRTDYETFGYQRQNAVSSPS